MRRFLGEGGLDGTELTGVGGVTVCVNAWEPLSCSSSLSSFFFRFLVFGLADVAPLDFARVLVRIVVIDAVDRTAGDLDLVRVTVAACLVFKVTLLVIFDELERVTRFFDSSANLAAALVTMLDEERGFSEAVVVMVGV